MSSRFKQSLYFIKQTQTYNVYHLASDSEFEKKYLERWDGISDYMEKHQEDIDAKYNLSHLSENLYASFRFIYQVDLLLDQMECDGISLEKASNLMTACSMLQVNSTDVFIHLDDDFSFSKKYSICSDCYVLANNLYQQMIAICSARDIDSQQTIQISGYDEIITKLRSKYIRSSLMVLKIFLIFVILQTSPLYSDGVHAVADKLIQTLREVFFNKRIIQVVINGDFYGDSDKPHSTTRLYIYFAMNNSDRYCIRLDFPHQGEECIHLNLNQPGIKQATGFPIQKNSEILEKCREAECLEKFFYENDDLYWFRHDFAHELKKIKDTELHKELDDFQHVQSHLQIESDSVSKANVTEFTMAIFEALNDYEIISRLDGTIDHDMAYQYILFQDYIYDVMLQLENVDFSRKLGISKYKLLKDKDIESANEIIHDTFRQYIKGKFPGDEVLLDLADADMNFYDFIMKCLDRLDTMC